MSAALLLLATLMPAVGPAPPSPIAVLPFKYVGDDRGLPRLQEALAVALIIDIDQTPGSSAIPWTDLRQAIDFRALYRGREAFTDVQACALARQVGATSVVAATYENPGDEIVLAARLLKVANGELLGSAMVSAPDAELHQARARLLRELFAGRVAPLGLIAAAPSAEKRDPPRALGMFGLALGSANNTRLGLLRKAWDHDPTSPYIHQALAELEKTAAAQAAWADLPAAEAEPKLKAVLAERKARAHDQHEGIMELFGFLVDCGYHRQVAVLARVLEHSSWPDELAVELAGTAVYWQFKTARERFRSAEAKQLGERYIKEHGRHRLVHVVKRQLAELDDEQPKSVRRQEKLAAKLVQLDLRQHQLEGRRCQILFNASLHLRAAKECAAFVERLRTSSEPRVQDLVREAWWTQAQALYEAGEFGQARAVVGELEKDSPDWYRTRQLNLAISHWPKE